MRRSRRGQCEHRPNKTQRESVLQRIRTRELTMSPDDETASQAGESLGTPALKEDVRHKITSVEGDQDIALDDFLDAYPYRATDRALRYIHVLGNC